MAHFAELNSSNEVIRVLVVDNSKIMDVLGAEQEQLGIDLLVNLVGGTWVQTSYNANIRRKYAGVGDTYSPDVDIFIEKSPHETWTLDDNYEWVAPDDFIFPEAPDGLIFTDQD